MVRAYPGQVAAYGQTTQKNTCETLTTSKPLTAGLFVAYADRGVKELTAQQDKVAGVIVRSLVKDEYKNGEPVDVMHINTGDEIWVQIAPDQQPSRGGTVGVVSEGEHAGKVMEIRGGVQSNVTIYTVLEVADDLVRITK